MSFDKTQANSGQPELPEIDTPANQDSQPSSTQQEASEVPPKKGMPGFLKFMLGFVLLLVLSVIGIGGYIFYMQQQSPSLSLLGTTQSSAGGSPAAGVTGNTPVPVPGNPPSNAQAVAPPVNPVEPLATSSQENVAAMFKQPRNSGTPQPDSTPSNAGNQQPLPGGISSEQIGAGPAKTAMEELAYGNGTEEFGHLSLGDDGEDLHVSVLETVHSLEEKQDFHEQRFKSFDLAATALHKRHGDQITQLTSAQDKQSEAILAIKSRLISIEKALKAQVDPKETMALIKATDHKVDDLIAQAKANDKNIKWLSRKRLCEAEAKLGITTYSKQCGTRVNSNTLNPTPQPAPQPAVIQSQAIGSTVQPLMTHRSNVEVPDTVGVINAPNPQANAMMALSSQQRPVNPCQYASRDWKLQIISSTGALVVRTNDGFNTLLEEGSPVDGLGRVQLFKSTGYPQYVQFTNGIVCGG